MPLTEIKHKVAFVGRLEGGNNSEVLQKTFRMVRESQHLLQSKSNFFSKPASQITLVRFHTVIFHCLMDTKPASACIPRQPQAMRIWTLLGVPFLLRHWVSQMTVFGLINEGVQQLSGCQIQTKSAEYEKPLNSSCMACESTAVESANENDSRKGDE